MGLQWWNYIITKQFGKNDLLFFISLFPKTDLSFSQKMQIDSAYLLEIGKFIKFSTNKNTLGEKRES